ncbi:uncharacterized protein BHQ10_002318 [Talaromyces amestolkiae]|uniref:Uncharacterized protein n=1 Tax=Talaromyces amestolkiae TaxID=1196081 RepID=A0A364KRX7_TALAM|nr:uncharacterized protein BHQ10_002318 [Talaromyces amestolkiae]RAO66306.1 hypothetical protein BHQ10_002318 [Talaromyces amestolkiae]
MAMLMDLGLHRASGIRGTTGLPLHYLRTFYSEPEVPRQRTLEERRAYIGCYHLLTTIALCNREMSVLKYTKYTDECLVTLGEMKEHPSDEYIVYLLRLHRIGEKIRRTLWDDPIDIAWGLAAPVGMCVRYLETELRQFMELIPIDLAQNTLLRSYVNTLEISLYGIALSDNFNDGDYGEYQLTRFNILRSCLIATKALLNQISDLPLEVRICTPSTCWSQFGQAVVVLSKLSLMENELWKGIYEQYALDFPQEIDRIAEKFSKLDSWTQGVDSRLFITEAYLKLGSRLKLMKETHEKIRVTQVERARDLTEENFGLDLGDLLPMPMLDLLDGEFWQQVL